MKVIVLGCGGSAGVPHIGGADGRGDWGACDPAEPRNRRMRSSIVVEGVDRRRFLVDTSPDMRTQLIDHGVGSVDAILYTHSHADHILGLDDVRILNRIIDRPMPVRGDAHTLAELARRFDYAFLPWRPPGFIRPVLEAEPIKSGDTISLAGMEITVFDQDHGFGRLWDSGSAVSPIARMSWISMSRPGRSSRVSIPGWSIASSGSRTGRMPHWMWCGTGRRGWARGGPFSRIWAMTWTGAG